MNGSGAANKGIYCAYRSFGITGSAAKRAGRRSDVTKTGSLSNWGNPEFRVELQKRFSRSAGERTTECQTSAKLVDRFDIRRLPRRGHAGFEPVRNRLRRTVRLGVVMGHHSGCVLVTSGKRSSSSFAARS
jgi:hypothetical protein